MIRTLGYVDVAPVAQRFARMKDEIWFFDTSRQEKQGAHRQTQFIPLIYDGLFSADFVRVERWGYFLFETSLEKLLDAMASKVKPVFGSGYWARALFTRLPAGAVIPQHKDRGLGLTYPWRIHCPIITNPDVKFWCGSVDEDGQHIEAGQVIEFNNQETHCVANNGHTARVHLICDWYKHESDVRLR